MAPNRQTLLFSATISRELDVLIKEFLREPITISVKTGETAKNIDQTVVRVNRGEEKIDVLHNLLSQPDFSKVLIFGRTKYGVEKLSETLNKRGHKTEAIHGNKNQNHRQRALANFKGNYSRILVATDVAARGIDVNDLTHVINYNLPDEAEVYTHRSGRTGRADKNGVSVIIINAKEQNKIKTIEKLIGKTISRAKIPTATEVCSKQLLHLVQEIENVEVKEEILEYTDLVYEKWKDLSKEEIIQKVLSAEFNRFLDYYRHAPDLNVQAEESRKGDREGYSNATAQKVEKGYKWVKMNVGFRQNVTTRHLLRLASSLGIGKKSVGKIDLRKEVTFIAISSSAAQFFADEMNNMEYRGNRLRAEVVND
jgi:ATP-dependent RNA helicase DeaD